MRTNLSKSLQLAVWRRDSWHCRYCLVPVFFAPTLQVFEELSPGHSYYHPNGKSGAMLPLLQRRWASVDHIQPVAKGGTDDEANLATACWECNLAKRDTPPERAGPPRAIGNDLVKLGWDGFASLYERLAKPDEWVRLLRR